jgi:hypothetical protein
VAEAAPGAARAPRAWTALAASLGFVMLLCLLGTPRWETNDDASMAMVAHGYGLASRGSPVLVFSGVLWGHFVRALPEIAGIPGYPLAAFAALVLAGAALLHHLRLQRVAWPLAAGAIALVLGPATLFPQFTLGSGLLATAAVFAARTYGLTGGLRHLATAVALAFAAWIVRPEEAALVLAVGAPLLPWRALVRDRKAFAAAALLLAAIAVSNGLDQRALAGPEWRAFVALDAPRARFTDYDAGVPLWEQHRDIAVRHGYSANDLDLVGNYFFADPSLADPRRLDAMLAELGPLPAQPGSLARGVRNLEVLGALRLWPLAACALVLGLLFPRPRVAAVAALIAAAVIAVGVSGRPGFDVIRVYVPPLGLLVLAALPAAGEGTRGRRLAAAATVALAFAAIAWMTLPAARATRAQVDAARADVAALGTEPVAVWGNAFPYTAAYPVFLRDPRAAGVRIDSLGTDTLAPYSVAMAERAAGRGLLERLRSRSGLRLVATDPQVAMLGRYCAERFHGHLQQLADEPMRTLRLRTVRCAAR